MIRALVVDDEEVAREELAEALKFEGIEVATASSAQAALIRLADAKASGQPFDVVLLDIVMPQQNGDEIVPVIHQRYPFMTIIMVTAFATVSTAVETLFHGAYQYLTKPVKPVHLISVLRAGLAQKRLAKLRDTMHFSPESDDWRFNIAEIIRDAFPATHFFLAILSSDDTALRIEHGCDAQGNDALNGTSLPPASRLLPVVFRQQETVRINRRADVIAFGPVVPNAGSLAAAPIIDVNGVSEGLIDLECEEENVFSEYTGGVLREFAELVSFERRVQSYLEEYRRHQRELDRQCHVTARALAHQIKNPLHAIKASLSIVRDDLGAIPDQMRHQLERRLETAGRASGEIEEIINGLANLGEEIRVCARRVELCSLLRDRVLRYETISDNAGIGFLFDEAAEEVPVNADPLLLRAFDVLVENAVEACTSSDAAQESTQTIIMRVEKDKRKQVARVSVSDTGPGIAPDNMPRLFDPFFSTKGPDKVPHGYGLYSAKRLIIEHCGRISVNPDRKPGAGAEFIVEIPLFQEGGEAP